MLLLRVVFQFFFYDLISMLGLSLEKYAKHKAQAKAFVLYLPFV